MHMIAIREKKNRFYKSTQQSCLFPFVPWFGEFGSKPFIPDFPLDDDGFAFPDWL